MKNERDLQKAINQHMEMESFFTGDFTLRGDKFENRRIGSQSERLEEIRMQLQEIAEQICSCRKCQIGSTRLNAVPGEGNCDARIVFVGEAPGADEDAQGRPFVGRAGQLLTKIINAMGLQREDVFICNILKCRPPGNRDPKPDEIYNCQPYLQRQLELINPEIIVALGAHAARTLLDTTAAIGRLRGRFHDYYTSDETEPISLMPTYHPAYLLRNYSQDNRRRVWEDMKKVLEKLDLDVKS